MSRLRRSASNCEEHPKRLNLNSAKPTFVHPNLGSSGPSQAPFNFKRSGAETPTLHQLNKNKFDATRKWTELISSFVEEVPREEHRRFFIKSYYDVFSGQVAADTLTEILPRVFTDRKCDRSNAVRVLQKFIDDRIIEDISGGTEFKDDGTLFRITEQAFLKYGSSDPPPSKIRRSSSLNDRDRSSTPCTSRLDCSRPVKLTKSGSALRRKFRHGRSPPAPKSTAPVTPGNLGFHSKTSQNFSFNSSHLNLSLNVGGHHKKQAESPPVPLDKRFAKVIDFNADDMESRRHYLDAQLIGLLDGIIVDKKFSETERHRKVMEFKHNYPKIFAQRFPENSYVAPSTPLISRVKDFLGVG